MPAGDVFGLDGIILNKSNPVVVSTIGINSTGSSAGIAVTSGILDTTAGIATLTFDTAAGLSTTPFYVGAKIAVSRLVDTLGVAHTGYNGTFIVTGFAGTTTVSYATTDYVGAVTTSITTTGLVVLVTDTQVTNTTWSSSQTHGWFGGGFSPTTFSTVDRIDFSNDLATASVRSPLSAVRYYSAATGNSNYGWFGGGNPAPTFSTVDRIDFSNDSGTTSVRGPLTAAKNRSSAVTNTNYGWWCGGIFPSAISTVDRIDFSNDSSTASPRGPLAATRYQAAAAGNPNYGWIGGGNLALSTIERIDFSNDFSTASPRGTLLSTARAGLGACGNSNYGWFGGGTATYVPSANYQSRIDRIDFSNDAAAALVRSPLSAGKYFVSATANSNYGWFGGGSTTVPAYTSTIDRIDFSNDLTTISTRGQLSQAKSRTTATSGQARSSSTRPQKTGSYGWFGGGLQFPSTPSLRSTVDRIDFSNDLATASPRGVLSQARYGVAATGNSNYGWFGGGIIPPNNYTATVDRIDFSNDLATASPRGPLSAARYYLAATGNSNYGWFGGGSAPGAIAVTTVDRIDFSNDFSTASPRGSLLTLRNGLAATGNSNYGWFGGGYSFGSPGYKTAVERINFSNDLATASTRAGILIAKQNLAATGNSNYGWFGGGKSGPAPILVYATVERIDFSNDLATTSIRASLSNNRFNLASTGNSNYGWFGGGYFPAVPSATSNKSTVERINFSNDFSSAATRGPLSSTRYTMGATSNTTR